MISQVFRLKTEGHNTISQNTNHPIQDLQLKCPAFYVITQGLSLKAFSLQPSVYLPEQFN